MPDSTEAYFVGGPWDGIRRVIPEPLPERLAFEVGPPEGVYGPGGRQTVAYRLVGLRFYEFVGTARPSG